MENADQRKPASGQGVTRHAAVPLRIVVVRDEPLRDLVDRAVTVADVSATVVRVPSFLAAMGELSQRPADVVIGPIDAIEGMVEPMGRSLRELASDARLVLIGEPEHSGIGADALGADFDAVLFEPFDTNELAKAMRLGGIGLASAPLSRGTAVRMPTAEAPVAPLPPIEPDAGDLGDADLIDALLSGGPFIERIEAMVTAQSGVQGIGMALPGKGAAPEGHATAAIDYRGMHLGALHAPPPATQEQLVPWAQWAARWLAMQERIQHLGQLAMRDELTGAWNRRYFDSFLARILDRARLERQQVTLLVFDIDDFKSYNDRYGHAAGDEILREAARLMQTVVRQQDVVARIGGDEFAVIFWDHQEPRQKGSRHPDDVMRAARRFQQAICAHRFPKLAEDALSTLTISGGLASYPWDGQTPADLLDRADKMALQSKQQGKNAITLGPGALRQCDPAD